jgi:hypothetical protein
MCLLLMEKVQNNNLNHLKYCKSVISNNIMDDLFRIILIILLSLSIFSCNRKTTTTTTTTDYSTTDVTYSGVWIKDNSTSWYAMSDATLDEFSTVNINYSSYRIIDFEVVNIGDEIKFYAIFISDGKADTHCFRCDFDTFNSFNESMEAYEVMPIDYEMHYENGNWYSSIIYTNKTYGWATRYVQDKTTFLSEVSNNSALGYYLMDVEIDYLGGKFSSLYWTKSSSVLFYWDLDYDDLINNATTAAENGYYPTDIEIYEIDGVKKYNVILNYGSSEWEYLIEGSYEEFNAKNTLMQNTGYRPIDFEVHTSEERNMGRLGDNLSVKNINLVYINPKLKKRN